tara:strand:- start:1136 stop:1486 length:351 start_codon:yes stop_codon:yes gene_type:complete
MSNIDIDNLLVNIKSPKQKNLSIKLCSSPIDIGSTSKNSPLHNTDYSYNTFDCSIPSYGSLEEKKSDIPIYNYRERCSESSNFPIFPADKTPPNENYMKDIYLNYIADNQLKTKFE